MIRLFYIGCITIVLLNSCSTARKAQTPVVKDSNADTVVTASLSNPKDDSIIFIRGNYRQIIENRIKFNSFSAKIDLDITDGDGRKTDANAHVRMLKDSLIWVSVTGPLGIEGLRTLITRDSVKLLDKQNKTYKTRSIDYLQDIIELPVDLTTLQDLILGNPVFLDSNIQSYFLETENITFESIGEFFKNIFAIGAEDKLIQYSRLNDLDQAKNRTCNLVYKEYENKKGGNFSTKRTIDVSDKKKIAIKMNFKQYEFNETLSFPFSIPKSYDRE
ncbi:MAG: DUF4292 domain-containing protein [Chitinophagaceae bacterium]